MSGKKDAIIILSFIDNITIHFGEGNFGISNVKLISVSSRY